jgi:hypothetical protein
MSTPVTYRVTAEVPAVPDYTPLLDFPSGRFLAPTKCRLMIEVEGEPGLTNVEATMALRERRYVIETITAHAFNWDPVGVDRAAIQRLPLGRLLRTAIGPHVQIEQEYGTEASRFTRTYRAADNADPLWRVALVYSIAHAFGEPPTTAVADDLGITRGAAAQRVRRAREADYLPPTTQGRAS